MSVHVRTDMCIRMYVYIHVIIMCRCDRVVCMSTHLGMAE